jgi:prolyl-tRNA editing enzyme YbaK/EbsC (Cys-tRNA(Pro) deacylase)
MPGNVVPLGARRMMSVANGVDRFLAEARGRGLTVEVQDFPQGTRTAQDAAAAIGCDVAQIVKSLVFVADDDAILVLTSGANRVDEASLRRDLEVSTLRKATADEVREVTGYAIGGTPPFGHRQHLRVLCDRDLTRHDEVWAAAGSPSTVFPITPSSLLEVTGAEVRAVS